MGICVFSVAESKCLSIADMNVSGINLLMFSTMLSTFRCPLRLINVK